MNNVVKPAQSSNSRLRWLSEKLAMGGAFRLDAPGSPNFSLIPLLSETSVCSRRCWCAPRCESAHLVCREKMYKHNQKWSLNKLDTYWIYALFKRRRRKLQVFSDSCGRDLSGRAAAWPTHCEKWSEWKSSFSQVLTTIASLRAEATAAAVCGHRPLPLHFRNAIVPSYSEVTSLGNFCSGATESVEHYCSFWNQNLLHNTVFSFIFKRTPGVAVVLGRCFEPEILHICNDNLQIKANDLFLVLHQRHNFLLVVSWPGRNCHKLLLNVPNEKHSWD